MTLTSDQLSTAADRLRSAAGDLDAAIERHETFGRGLGTALGDVSHAWGSPEAERFIQQGLGLATIAGQVPAGLTVASAALSTLANTAATLATELAGYEQARAAALATQNSLSRQLTAADPDDADRIRSLARRSQEASASASRAATNIEGVATRWTAGCRSAAAGVRTGTGQVQRVGPWDGPSIGPAPPPATGSPVLRPGGPSGGDALTWGWNFVASPAIVAFNERARTQILHLAPRPGSPTTVVRSYEQAVVRRGHWRNPPRLRPGSPLAGTVRHPTWVRPVLGPVQVTERVVPAPPAPAMRGVAERIELPRSAWGRATRVLGPVGNIATIGTTGYGEYVAVSQRDDLTTTQQTVNVATTTLLEGGGAVGGGIIGAKGGALGGAAIGTMICPGVGTAIGAVGGAVVGGVAGSAVGQKIGGAISDGIKKLNPKNLFG